MADENETTDQTPKNTPDQGEQKRVLASGASGDPEHPEAGAPGYQFPSGLEGMEDVTPPAPGETPKVVDEPQVPTDQGPVQPHEASDVSEAARRAPRR